MAKRHYKTLMGLLSQTLYGQINFVDFHWGKMYHKKHGWVHFTLPDAEMHKGYSMMAKAIYSRDVESKISLMKKYKGNAHGILQGLTISMKRKEGDFCAGQDYPSELRIVQGIFRNGN